MSRFLWAVFLLGPAHYVVAQNNPEVVCKIKSTDLEIRVKGETVSITEHTRTEKVFYSNFSKYSRESVVYSDLLPLLAIEAETLPPEGRGKKTKVSTYETADILTTGVFYGGYKKRDFVYPNLTAGATGRLEYSKSVKDHRLLPSFYFESNIPVLSSRFSVTFPETMKIRYLVVGAHKNEVTFSEQNVGKRKQLTWTLGEVPAFESQKSAPSYQYYRTHVIVFIDSYEIDHHRVPVLDSVPSLFKWLSTLLDEVPRSGDYTELDKTTDALAPPQATPAEKAKNIFRWVQQHIKYIAFEDGMAGFIPRTPSDVFYKRYGDCKDMATLLTYMLNHVGLTAYPAWIGTRDLPYTYEELPSPASSNHMICGLKQDTSYVFLDATDPYAAFGKPSAFTQGKEALVRLSPKDYKIIRVPVMGAQENQRIDSIHVWIEGDGIRGKITSQLSGYRKRAFKIQKLKAEIDPKIKLVRDFFGIGANNIQISNVAMSGLDDPEVPLIVTFEFLQPGYYKSVGERLYMNLNLAKSIPGEKVDEATRSQMIASSYEFVDKTILDLKLPPGYRLQSVPKNTQVKESFYLVTTSYRSDASAIVYERTLSSDYLYLDKPQFRQWNDFVQAASDINGESVSLIKLK